MKLLGGIIVVGCLYMFSGQVYARYDMNIYYCEILKDITADMKGTMMYAPSDIYTTAGRYVSEKYSPFDKVFSESIASGIGFMDILRRRMAEVAYMDDELRYTFCSGMERISESSREGAISHLEIMTERIDGYLKKIRHAKETKGTMYRKLSVMGGLFVCILLW